MSANAPEIKRECHLDDLAEQEGAAGDAFIVDVDGWEGPLDLLLALARSQKAAR